MKVDKQPTWTHLTTEALRTADDFMSFDQLLAKTGATRNQLHAALWHLQRCRVVDAVASPGGLYWFYRGDDLRTHELCERCPEDRPRRARRVRRVRKPFGFLA